MSELRPVVMEAMVEALHQTGDRQVQALIQEMGRKILAVLPPEDHQDFVELRSRGFTAMRRSLENRAASGGGTPEREALQAALTLIQRHHAVNVMDKLSAGQECPVCSGFLDSPELLAAVRRAALAPPDAP